MRYPDKSLVYLLSLLIVLVSSCKGKKEVSFDPFSYDPQDYEKVHLNYKIYGKADTTLFFIHGWNLNLTYWDNQLPYFSSSYNVVVLDLAGHGKSGKDRENWTIESFSKDIVSIIDKEQLKNVILIGHSMAGEIALEVATTIPDKIIGIIGVDNFKNIGMTVTEENIKGVQPYIKKFMTNYTTMAEDMVKENIRTKDTAISNRIMNDYTNADPTIAVPILMNLFPKAADAKNRLQVLQFPLRIIMCSYSPFDSTGLTKYCKNGFETIMIDSSGHFPMVEQPQKFNEALNYFLSKI
jgi:sigma-B regulation protein RsbQ